MVHDIGRDFAFAVMSGVALQRLFAHGERPASEYIDALKQLLRGVRTGADARADRA